MTNATPVHACKTSDSIEIEIQSDTTTRYEHIDEMSYMSSKIAQLRSKQTGPSTTWHPWQRIRRELAGSSEQVLSFGTSASEGRLPLRRVPGSLIASQNACAPLDEPLLEVRRPISDPHA